MREEKDVLQGMKAWHGGDMPPVDWAGPESDTLLRNGYRVKGGYRWTHHSDAAPSGTDIVAYTPQVRP